MLKHSVFCDYFKGINKRLGFCLLASSYITHKSIFACVIQSWFSVFMVVQCMNAMCLHEKYPFSDQICVTIHTVLSPKNKKTDCSFQYSNIVQNRVKIYKTSQSFSYMNFVKLMHAVFRTSKFDFLEHSVTTTLLFVLHLCFLNSANTDPLKRPIVQE